MQPRPALRRPGGGVSRLTLPCRPSLWGALRAGEELVWLSLSVVGEVEYLTPASRKFCSAFSGSFRIGCLYPQSHAFAALLPALPTGEAVRSH